MRSSSGTRSYGALSHGRGIEALPPLCENPAMTGLRLPLNFRRIIGAAFLAGCLVPTLAISAVYESKLRGFSVTYPDGWTVLSSDDLEESREAVSELQKKAGGSGADPRAVVITEPNVDPPELAAHINVTITRGRFSVTEDSVPKLLSEMETTWTKMGVQGELLEHSLREIGSNHGLYFERRGTDPATGVEKRYWQHITPGREQAYTIICAVPEVEAESFRETCLSVLESFKKDTGVEGFFSSIPMFVRDGFQGAIIGLIVALFLRWWNKRKEVQENPNPSILE